MNCCKRKPKISIEPPACGQGGSCYGTAKCHVEEWVNNSQFQIVIWPQGSNPENNPNVSPDSTTTLNPGDTYSYVYYGDDVYIVINLLAPLSDGSYNYYSTLTMFLGQDSSGNFFPKPMFGGKDGHWDSTISWNYNDSASRWINSGSPADGQGYFLNHYNLTGEVPINFVNNSDNGASWHSGMNNDDNTIPGPFWVLDYGFSNWSVDTSKNVATGATATGATASDTAVVNQQSDPQHKPSGSRAWPLYICKNSAGDQSLCGSGCDKSTPGLARNGVWMIDVKVGSKLQKGATQADRGSVCECFYLAQRKTLYPGTAFYADGSGGGGNNVFSTEIDMFETLWKDGPQINLPPDHCWTDSGTSINSTLPYCVSGDESFGQLCTWENIEKWTGSDYNDVTISYGAYIDSENNLYIFAYYTPQNSDTKKLLFCNCQGSQSFDTSLQSGPVKGSPKGVGSDSSEDIPFAPYIGAWSNTNELDSDVTEYSNFYYVSVDKLGESTPLDDEGKEGGCTFYDKVVR
jgi:hypothetical protein